MLLCTEQKIALFFVLMLHRNLSYMYSKKKNTLENKEEDFKENERSTYILQLCFIFDKKKYVVLEFVLPVLLYILIYVKFMLHVFFRY